MFFLLLGCGGPSDETLLDELRVLAIVAEPPEVAPGESGTLTTTVVDPEGVGPDMLVWTCTPSGSTCLESGFPGMGTRTGRLEEGAFVDVRSVPLDLEAVVGDGTTVLPVFTWALACTPGVCPVIDLAAASPAPGTGAGDELAALLNDPFAMMASLPITGTSLATSRFAVSTRATPLTNPVVHAEFTSVDASPGESATLDFTVENGETAYGYATAGGFGVSAYPVTGGAVQLDWFAPKDGTDADLYVVVNGAEGGSALWRGPTKRR